MTTSTFYNLFTYSGYNTIEGIFSFLFGFENCTLLQPISNLPKGTECEVYIDIINQEARFYYKDELVTYKLNLTLNEQIESKVYD